MSERFVVRIDLKRRPEHVLRLFELNAVRSQMLFHPTDRFVGLLVVTECLRLGIERLCAAEAVRDVAEMAHCARKVAFENVRVLLIAFPASDCIEEVAEMIAP